MGDPSQHRPLIVRVNHDDAPDDVIDKINAVLTSRGLRLVENDAGEGFILYSLVDGALEVYGEVGTLEDQLDRHARGHAASVQENWGSIPDAQREPEALVLAAFSAGASAARVAIECCAKISALVLAERARSREKQDLAPGQIASSNATDIRDATLIPLATEK